jgi:hypothetical protein
MTNPKVRRKTFLASIGAVALGIFASRSTLKAVQPAGAADIGGTQTKAPQLRVDSRTVRTSVRSSHGDN